MLRYIYAHDLHKHPALARSMFRDRTCQFRDRLGWPVQVNDAGEERDAYDALDPLYVIWQNDDGSHGGSMRFLPTTGPTMVNDVFSDIMGGGAVVSPLIWECTRFCLSKDAKSNVAAALMLPNKHHALWLVGRIATMLLFVGSDALMATLRLRLKPKQFLTYFNL